MAPMARSILWLRRDLRWSDHPALAAAHAAGDVVPLFVVDPALLKQVWINLLSNAVKYSAPRGDAARITVTGDVIGAATDADITGKVEGDLYLAAGQLDINGGAHLMRYPDLNKHVLAAFS